jgi:hypothetical protein
MKITVVFLICLIAFSAATPTKVCQWFAGFGKGLINDQCSASFSKNCDAWMDIFSNLAEVFEGQMHNIISLGSNIYEMGKSYYDMWVECQVWPYFRDFWAHMFEIFKEYPTRGKDMSTNFTCMFRSLQLGDETQSGRCTGELWKLLFKYEL